MALQFVQIQPFIKKQINALKNKNILSKQKSTNGQILSLHMFCRFLESHTPIAGATTYKHVFIIKYIWLCWVCDVLPFGCLETEVQLHPCSNRALIYTAGVLSS